MTAFSRAEAENLWAYLVYGWAQRLDPSGARTWMEGVRNYNEPGGSHEGITRMLWGIGGWLSQPGRPGNVSWRGKAHDLTTLMADGILAGCDPASPGSWWHDGPHEIYFDQRTVETAPVAYALWQTRERIWDHYSAAQQRHILDYLTEFGKRPDYWANNWALFWLLNHTFRKTVGASYEQDLIDDVIGPYLDRVYIGDGWYDDGDEPGRHHFDDYNYLVFVTHVLAWAEMDGDNQPARRDELFERTRLLMAHFPYFFASDGAYPEFGRSLTYKFARLAAALWAYKHDLWPHSTGLLRHLTGQHIRWYLNRGAVRGSGTFVQALTGTGSLAVREPYISTASPYWTMLVFNTLWSLPNDDPFWQAEPEPLPVEQGDYVKVYPQPGWVVAGQNGHVLRFNAKSQGRVPPYVHKYGKFVYGSLFPFNVGLVDGQYPPDNALCLHEDGLRVHRDRNLHSAVGEPGWLRMRYELDLNGVTYTVDTVIVINGAWHLRVHHIAPPEDVVSTAMAMEGGATLGYDPGQIPDLRRGDGWFAVSMPYPDARTTMLVSVHGYGRVGYRSADGVNLAYAGSITPLLYSAQVESGVQLACMVYMGPLLDDPGAAIIQPESITWDGDGTFSANWRGYTWRISPLPM